MGIPVFKWLVYDPNWVLTLSKNFKNLFFYFLYIIASEKDVPLFYLIKLCLKS